MAPVGALRPIRRERSHGWGGAKLSEIWRSRELVGFLIWRELKVRYRQTALGASWAVLQPVFTMLVFSVFFGRLAGMPSDGLPYPLFCLAGLVPWTFFSTGLTQGSNSLVGSASMVRKLYFPRLSLPLSAVLAGLPDLALASVVLLGVMLWYGQLPTASLILLPLAFFLLVITTLGAVFWLSAINARYRDVRYALPFVTQLLLFSTPIAYPSSLLPEQWRVLYAINPMVSIVESVRWALLDAPGPSLSMLLLSCGISLLLLVSGATYFWRVETTVADVI